MIPQLALGRPMPILFKENWGAEHNGKLSCEIIGWFIDHTGKRVESSPHYISRYAEHKVVTEAKNKIRAELGAV